MVIASTLIHQLELEIYLPVFVFLFFSLNSKSVFVLMITALLLIYVSHDYIQEMTILIAISCYSYRNDHGLEAHRP